MALETWDETQLTPEQEQRYRNSARRMYWPGEKIQSYWHPMFQEECRRMNEEKGVTPYDELPGDQPVAPASGDGGANV